MIAGFQILLLDNVVGLDLINSLIHSVDDSISWNECDVEYLINKKIIPSFDDLRIVHIESAKVVISCFLKTASKKEKDTLRNVIQLACLQKIYSPLGLVWLLNSIRDYSRYMEYDEFLVSQCMIDSVFENMESINDPIDQAYIIYFMEKIFSFQCEKNGWWYFNKYIDTIANWVSNCNKDNAYAFSNIVNTVINYGEDLHAEFTKRINWDSLCGCFFPYNL